MADGDVVAKIFSKMDADNSGTICQSELNSAFKDFDKDDNGSISRDEWVTNVVSQFGATSQQAATMFNKLDSGSRGEISLDELNRVFKTMDADGNGTVTKEEFFEYWLKLIQA